MRDMCSTPHLPAARPGPCQPIHRDPIPVIQTRAWAQAGALTLRAIRPQDEALLADLLNNLSPLARRNRFHGAIKVSPAQLRQMSCVDHRRHLALVVTAQVSGAEQLIADARYCIDDDGHSAEFALVVAERWQRLGIGAWAMQSLEDAAAAAGIDWLNGEVLQANAPMLGLSEHCGFALCPHPEDEQIVRAQMRLSRQARPAPRARRGVRAWLQQAWLGRALAAVG